MPSRSTSSRIHVYYHSWINIKHFLLIFTPTVVKVNIIRFCFSFYVLVDLLRFTVLPVSGSCLKSIIGSPKMRDDPGLFKNGMQFTDCSKELLESYFN